MVINGEMGHCFRVLIKTAQTDQESGDHQFASDAWDALMNSERLSFETRQEIITFGSLTCRAIYMAAWAVNIENYA